MRLLVPCPAARVSAAAVVLCLSLTASGEPPGAEREPPRPRPQAIEACAALARDAACRFPAERGTVSGACWAPPGRPLACRPSQPPADDDERARPPAGDGR